LSKNYSLETVEIYQHRLRSIHRFWEEYGFPSDPRKVEPLHVRVYLDSLRGLSTSSQHGRGTTLLGFLRWAGNTQLRDFKLKITVSRSRVDWLTVEESSAVLMSAPTLTLRAAELLMLYCGLRREEVAELRLSDLHPTHINVQGKGRKGRRIPVKNGLLVALAPYMEWRRTLPGEFFLVHRHCRAEYGKWTPGGLTEALRRHGLSMGRHLSPHTLRRSFGRHLYKAGMPLQDISYLYGHTSVQVTIHYLGIKDEDVESSLNRFQPDY